MTTALKGLIGRENALVESILEALIGKGAQNAYKWFIDFIEEHNERLFGFPGSWWRILLRLLRTVQVDPALILARCLPGVGPDLLLRFPEMRMILRDLVQSNVQVREMLAAQLSSFLPGRRMGAAQIILASGADPQFRALIALVATWKQQLYHREPGLLTCMVELSNSTLASLAASVTSIPRESQVLALCILFLNGWPIDDSQKRLLCRDSFHWRHDEIRKLVFKPESELFRFVPLLAADLEVLPNDRYSKGLAFAVEHYDDPVCLGLRTICAVMLGLGSSRLQEVMHQLTTDENYRNEVLRICVTRKEGVDRPKSFFHLLSAAIDNPTKWQDVLWCLFCNDLDPTFDSEYVGMLILDYMRTFPQQASALGGAARDCLLDSRMTTNRFKEHHQWLAILADEGGAGDPDLLRGTLNCDKPPNTAAAAAVMSRLGEFQPPWAPRASRQTESSLFIEDSNGEDLRASLTAFARTAEDFHPAVIATLYGCLRSDIAIDATFCAELAMQGPIGCFIAAGLRFCFDLTYHLPETIPLLRFLGGRRGKSGGSVISPFFWRAYTIQRDTLRWLQPELLGDYVSALDGYCCNEYEERVALAIERLTICGTLLPSTVAPLLSDFSENVARSRELFELLVVWFIGLDETERRESTLRPTLDALVYLRDAELDGPRFSAWPFLFFSTAAWMITDGECQDADFVFLRGLAFALGDVSGRAMTNDATVDSVMAGLDELLRRVPRVALRRTISFGSEGPSPGVRALCLLLKAIANDKN